MSAIGSYEILSRSDFQRCLDAARNIRTETSGKWLFKTTRTAGATEFAEMWQASTRKQVTFDYSGYVLGNYIDAQEVINQTRLVDEQSDVSVTAGQGIHRGVRVRHRPSSAPSISGRQATGVLSRRVGGTASERGR